MVGDCDATMTLTTTIVRIDCWSDENCYDAGDDAVVRTRDLLGWNDAANAALNVVDEISGANFVKIACREGKK